MSYFWVNQNQTYRQEIEGGYLWSPKRKRNRARNPFYEFMREVAPGDLVFSFAEQRILAVGIARSHAYESPKPAEFGAAGRNWADIGWRVDVAFQRLLTLFRPAEWIDDLAPLLPEKYSPLQRDGRGVQSIYLTRLPKELALRLGDLIGGDVAALTRFEAEPPLPSDLVGVVQEQIAAKPELVLWEEHLRRRIESDSSIGATEKEALVMARRGQGLFRQRVQEHESRCRITLVDRPEHLRASHCKPWRDCTNAERLDGENGLLLTPSIDHLFDRGFISFCDDGRLLVSPVAHGHSLTKMGVPVGPAFDAGSFTAGQQRFLEYHRDEVFLLARLGA